jgi:hypothetical protein
MYIHKILIFLTILIFTSSCDRSSTTIEIIDEAYILKESVFNCGTYETFDINEDFFVSRMAEFKDFFLYGGTDGFVVRAGIDGEKLLVSEIDVNAILVQEQEVIIGGNDGIFTLDESLNLVEQSKMTCLDAAVTADNEIVFVTRGLAGSGEGFYRYNIMEYDAVNQTVLHFTDSTSFTQNYLELAQIETAENGLIWAMSTNSELVELQGRTVKQIFNSENVDFLHPDNNSRGSDQIIANGNELFYVLGNGVQYRRLMRYNGEWLVLKEMSFNTATIDKEFEVMRGTISDLIVQGNFIFMGSTQGIHRFEILDRPIEEEFDVIHDPGLPSTNITQFYQIDSRFYIITSGNTVTKIDC